MRKKGGVIQDEETEKRKIMFWGLRKNHTERDLRDAITDLVGEDVVFEAMVGVGRYSGPFGSATFGDSQGCSSFWEKLGRNRTFYVTKFPVNPAKSQLHNRQASAVRSERRAVNINGEAWQTQGTGPYAQGFNSGSQSVLEILSSCNFQ